MQTHDDVDTTEDTTTDYPQETEVLADSKGRLALSTVGAKPGRRYLVRREADDVLSLIPARLIPEREMIVWERPDLVKEILLGIEQANRGETRDLGDFSKYADDED